MPKKSIVSGIWSAENILAKVDDIETWFHTYLVSVSTCLDVILGHPKTGKSELFGLLLSKFWSWIKFS